jgi:hypothetical protein
MMAFCNIHCLRKSSRIIFIPTTSVNVLWDAIVPLSSTPTLIDRPFAKHRNSLSFGTHQWCFLTLTINDVDTQAHIRKRIFHLGKGVYFYVFFFLFFSCINTVFFSLIELILLQYCFRHCAFSNLDWGITMYHHFKNEY